ncbi:MAG: hypothetical protein AB7K24_31550, partial [Gemmataceae bacterium]
DRRGQYGRRCGLRRFRVIADGATTRALAGFSGILATSMMKWMRADPAEFTVDDAADALIAKDTTGANELRHGRALVRGETVRLSLY